MQLSWAGQPARGPALVVQLAVAPLSCRGAVGSLKVRMAGDSAGVRCVALRAGCMRTEQSASRHAPHRALVPAALLLQPLFNEDARQKVGFGPECLVPACRPGLVTLSAAGWLTVTTTRLR